MVTSKVTEPVDAINGAGGGLVEVIVSAMFLPGSYVTGEVNVSVIMGTGIMVRVAVPVPLG